MSVPATETTTRRKPLMVPKIGYLLPTRERVMEGRPETGSLLELAARAESLGFDSVWVGDSLLARPRHDPLTLLAAVAARTHKVMLGTAVFLPALRNPVVLAHQLATLDQISEGRLVLGAGIASDLPNIRAEFAAAGVPFEGRVGRMMEGLRLARALWTGNAVNWEGRWPVKDGVLGPTPYRPGGPPIWMAGSVRPALERAARHFDGWFANEADLARWSSQWAEVQQILRETGRDTSGFVAAIYVTLAIDENVSRADGRIDAFLEKYYGQPAAMMRKRQGCYAGPAAGAAEYLQAYVSAGANHIIVRFTGEPDDQFVAFSRIRAQLGW
jgi:alkanesulfonate monooxygenase SsuD/methylene tetrahydromethanopterin reductase-like flavin-dependent oxidoreductase (luciferase family)